MSFTDVVTCSLCTYVCSYSRENNTDDTGGGRGRGRGRGRDNSQQGRGGRGRGSSNDNYYGGGGNNNNSNNNQNYYSNNNNGYQNHGNKNNNNHNNNHNNSGNQRSMFKPDMIQDPWLQLAQKLVPKGILNENELNNSFKPIFLINSHENSKQQIFLESRDPRSHNTLMQGISESENVLKEEKYEAESESFGENYLVYNHHNTVATEGEKEVVENEEEIDIDDDDEYDENDEIIMQKSNIRLLLGLK